MRSILVKQLPPSPNNMKNDDFFIVEVICSTKFRIHGLCNHG